VRLTGSFGLQPSVLFGASEVSEQDTQAFRTDDVCGKPKRLVGWQPSLSRQLRKLDVVEKQKAVSFTWAA